MTFEEQVTKRFNSFLFDSSEYLLDSEMAPSLNDVFFFRENDILLIQAPNLSPIRIPFSRFKFILSNQSGSITYKKQQVKISVFGKSFFLKDENGEIFYSGFYLREFTFLSKFLENSKTFLTVMIDGEKGYLYLSSDKSPVDFYFGYEFEKKDIDSVKKLFNIYFEKVGRPLIVYDKDIFNDFFETDFSNSKFIDYKDKLNLNNFILSCFPYNVDLRTLARNFYFVAKENEISGTSSNLEDMIRKSNNIEKLRKELKEDELILKALELNRLVNKEEFLYFIFKNNLEEIPFFKEIISEKFESISINEKQALHEKTSIYSKMFNYFY